MARIEVVVCDRCSERVNPDAQTTLRIERRDERGSRDLCPKCRKELDRFLGGGAIDGRSEDAIRAEILEELGRELSQAKAAALDGLQAISEGANADRLGQHFRDVVSHARRGPQ